MLFSFLNILIFTLSFLTGILTKVTDNLIDEQAKVGPKLKYVFGAVFGISAGYLLSLSVETATIGIAVVIGVLLHERIDRSHQLAVALLVGMVAFLGLPQVSIPLLLVFIFFAFADEALNEYSDNLRKSMKRINRTLEFFIKERPLLIMAGFAVSIYLGNWIYFIAIFLYQIGYEAGNRLFYFAFRQFSETYGTQFIFDSYKCNSEKLNSVEFVRRMLDELPNLIGMQKISEPSAFHYYSEKEDESGVSGVVIIAESHIAIHTYPKKQLVKTDIVSCRAFNTHLAEEYLKSSLQPKEIIRSILNRGKEYPKNIEEAEVLLRKERKQLKLPKIFEAERKNLGKSDELIAGERTRLGMSLDLFEKPRRHLMFSMEEDSKKKKYEVMQKEEFKKRKEFQRLGIRHKAIDSERKELLSLVNKHTKEEFA